MSPVEHQNKLIEQWIKVQKDWRIPLRNGILFGFGSAVGAGLVISLVTWALKPLKAFEQLSGPIDRLTQALERSSRK